MELYIFEFFIDYRGHHRKGVSIYNVTRVNLEPKPLFQMNKNCIFEHHREVQTLKNLSIDITFVMKIFF